jgi:hypothetical protein
MLLAVENRGMCRLKVVRRHHSDGAATAKNPNVCKRP